MTEWQDISTITVRLAWHEDALRAGQVRLGRISHLPITDSPKWAAFSEVSGAPVTLHETAWMARKAVIEMARDALLTPLPTPPEGGEND